MYNCVPQETLIYQCQNGMLFLLESTENTAISAGENRGNKRTFQ